MKQAEGKKNRHRKTVPMAAAVHFPVLMGTSFVFPMMTWGGKTRDVETAIDQA